MSARIPVTIVTGFLGSGKTTLLRHLLLNSGRKLAVIVNEFGSVGIDGDMLKGCGFCNEEDLECRLYELNNGCLCCTVQEDFLPTMEKLLSSSSSIDGIIVETSGLALPIPLLQALAWPEIRSKVYVNGVVTIVDGEALSLGSPVADLLSIEKQRELDDNIDHITSIDELFSNQLAVADLVLISRSDLIKPSLIDKLVNDLRTNLKESIPILSISKGVIEPSIVLGLSSSLQKVEIINSFDHDDHHHLKVYSAHVQIECDLYNGDFHLQLIELVKVFKIIRLKGRLWLRDKSFPLQIQMVGERFDSWYEKPHQSFWKPSKSGIDLVLLSFKECPKSSVLDAFSTFCASI